LKTVVEAEGIVRQLVECLQREPVVQTYFEKKAALERDLEARRILRYYGRAKRKMRVWLFEGDSVPDYLSDDFAILKKQYEENHIIQDYLQARTAVQRLVDRIFSLITTDLGLVVRSCGNCRQRDDKS
jgi:cell fate (sporulation/competence/biofilm development) regulator YlbF (YheA/YmcA/DUF963 family)